MSRLILLFHKMRGMLRCAKPFPLSSVQSIVMQRHITVVAMMDTGHVGTKMHVSV